MIPKIIHQLWKTADVPPAFLHWQSSWREMHPDFEYRLWTNADLERFIAEEAPSWRALFDSYRENICRADLARYLILQKFGGLYVDLDFECLRPHHKLLQKHSLMMGMEPDSHAKLKKAEAAGLKYIACNAWMASVPGHPLWDHLLSHLRSCASAADVLDRTGPFALTRALLTYSGDPIALLGPRVIYPVDKDACWQGHVQDLAFFEESTRGAYALHHWVGSWFRPQNHLTELPLPRARVQVHRVNRPADGQTPVPSVVTQPPLVSCLMVTRGDPHRVRQAIRMFRAQTHPLKQLVIVTDVAARRLALVMGEFPGNDIRWVFVPPHAQLTLGALRNRSVDEATGEYVVQWDDDDLHDPSRLHHQLAALLKSGAQACMLSRWTVWWPRRRRLFIAGRRTWEGSLLCAKAVMPRYPALAKGEDTAMIKRLLSSVDTVMLDAPRLYTYVIHGANTWDDEHFERIARRATADFSGLSYSRVLRELGRRVPVDAHLRAPSWDPPSPGSGLPGSRSESSAAPSVLILTPMRNKVGLMQRYFELLCRLDYPPERLSIGILEGDSEDDTFERLLDYQTIHRGRFRTFTLMRHDTGFRPDGLRWRPEIQLQRRAHLASVRNRLLSGALGHHQWVLWLDADLVDYPADLVWQLLEPGHDVAVPLCVKADGSVFDLNTFCFDPDRGAAERPEFLRDGLYQPPRGVGRRYLDSELHGWVPVDGVGGTSLLVRGDLHRSGLTFPAYSHGGYIETEGLAALAKDMGIVCWGTGRIKVVHADA